MIGVYLLHYDEPLAPSRTQHYMGMAADIDKRIGKHKRGTSGAALPMAFHGRGIGFVVTRTWKTKTLKEAYELEYKMHKHRKHGKKCEVCNA